MKMLTLKQRTEKALEAGFTNAQLAAAAGVTSGAVSQWLTTTQRLKAESVLGLVRLTGWRAEWWAEGKGPRQLEGSPRGSSESEPRQDRYTSETPKKIAVISANLAHPEAALLLRMVEASKLPGVTVEVKTWTEPNQADQAEEMETEDQQAGRHRHVGQSGVVVKATSRRSKKGVA
jgi:hypothetical protein